MKAAKYHLNKYFTIRDIKGNPGRLLQFVLILSLLLIFSSCSTSRRQLVTPLKEEGPEFLVQKLKQSEFTFHHFSARFNLDIRKNHSESSFTGQVRMVNDSIIWASVMLSGSIEAARMMITTDSVKVLEKLVSKDYFRGDYNYINQFLETNIDFSILQSLLLGNDFKYYESDLFKASIDEHMYQLSTPGRRKLMKYVSNKGDADRVFLQDIWMDPLTFKIKKVRIKETGSKGRTLQTEYDDFVEVAGHLFPSKIKLMVQDRKKFRAEIRFTKIDTGTRQTFPFNIPKSGNN